MVGLLSLSNELLVQVFSSSDTLQTAATISRVDKTLHSLWTQHNSHILKEILPNQIIGYEEAVELAILEEIWFNKNTELASPSKTSTRPHIRLYLETLLQNAKRATDATDALKAAREKEKAFLQREFCSDVTSYHIAYYRVRKMVLGHLHPEAQLQHVMYSTIKISPGDDNSIIAEVNNFLAFDEVRHSTVRSNYQRSALERSSTNSDWDRKGEPQRREFALSDGAALANHWRYVSFALNAWRIEIFRMNQKKIRQDALELNASAERLHESTLVMNNDKENRSRNIVAVTTKTAMIQKEIAAMSGNLARMHKDIVEAKLHNSRSFRGP
jgi:hypothetical protein